MSGTGFVGKVSVAVFKFYGFTGQGQKQVACLLRNQPRLKSVKKMAQPALQNFAQSGKDRPLAGTRIFLPHYQTIIRPN